MKKLFLITYQSAHWCGASDTKVAVWAENEDLALDKANYHMEDEMRELFSGEYDNAEEDGEDTYADEMSYCVDSIEEFTPEHNHWQWFIDSSQGEFYPVIGEPD